VSKTAAWSFDAAGAAKLLADIDALKAEAQAARDLIELRKAEGEAAVAKELLQLGAHSRARQPMPFGSLTWREREFLAFWVGGVYWRMRGGNAATTSVVGAAVTAIQPCSAIPRATASRRACPCATARSAATTAAAGCAARAKPAAAAGDGGGCSCRTEDRRTGFGGGALSVAALALLMVIGFRLRGWDRR
jgi:hypothetical protein